jgi:AcrR family transcriptional regulator
MTLGRPRSVTDEEIFAALARVVNAHGPGGATLARIAAEAGLSAPGLVQRFGSKHELLVAFARHSVGDTAALFRRQRAHRASDPLGAAVAALVELTAPAGSRAEVANNLGFLQLDLTDPDLRPHAVAQSRTIRRELRALLRDAVAAGQLRSCDTAAVAVAAYTAYNGALLTWALDGRGSARSWVRAAVKVVLAPYRTAGG